MKVTFIINKTITVPEFIKEKYNLKTQKVYAIHIFELVTYQDNIQFELASKLTENGLLPKYCNQMKVTKSTDVISHYVSSALKFITEQLNKPEFLTTA